MHEIITDFERPELALIEKVSRQHVGVAGFEAGPRQVAHPDIKPLNPKWRICGPAFTVRSDHWDDRLMGELAPKYAKPGDILVVDAGGHTEIAAWGMSMTIAAASVGVSGIVIDGSCMNSALLARERPQIPLFVRGVSATAKGSEQPGSLNVPVHCGGVIVYPGDIVLADSDGVVFMRPAMAEKIVTAAEAHDQRSKSDNKQNIPYYESRNSEAKVRAFGTAVWK
ncbi:MAG: RraA family protein [Rhodospirillaceae bacterium]